MSVVDWVCKKISLESASEQLSAITISRQQVLPSKLDACASVTTCCCRYRVDITGYSAQSPIRRVFYFVNWDFDRLLQIEVELKSHSIACYMFLPLKNKDIGYGL